MSGVKMAKNNQLVDLNVAKTFIEANWPNDPLLRQIALNLLDKLPRVDDKEVVHGEWERIEDDYFDLVTLKCSVCGEEWCFEDYDECLPKSYHYCPNCGAKMDGGKDNGLL
jgi:hypothetical protein